jgi:1-acyl-sn-glycerol-3-phosphate acyltransferase
MMRAHGWEARLDAPLPARCVVIAEPHTSNWDGYFLVLGATALDLGAHWMIKAEHRGGPVGALLRQTGAIFVERGKGGAVDAAVAAFASGGPMRLAIAASGTRRRTDRWRSGFLQIARRAKVPIALGYIDYARKRIGIGPALDSALPDAELRAAMIAFYHDKQGKRPEQTSEIRFGTDVG